MCFGDIGGARKFHSIFFFFSYQVSIEYCSNGLLERKIVYKFNKCIIHCRKAETEKMKGKEIKKKEKQNENVFESQKCSYLNFGIPFKDLRSIARSTFIC